MATTMERPTTEPVHPAPRGRGPWPVAFYRSAVGKKWVMAVTGIMIIGFVFAHAVGNLKVYLGEKRIANIPNGGFQRGRTLMLDLQGRDDEKNAVYVTRIRVAESNKDIYDELTASGRCCPSGAKLARLTERRMRSAMASALT